MNIDRRAFAKSIALAAGALALPSWPINAFARRLPVNRVTKIRVYYPPNYNANGPQAMTEGASGPTYLRPDGSPTHW